MEVLDEAEDLRSRLSLGQAEQSPPSIGVTPPKPTPRIHGTRSAVKQFVRLLLEGICAGTKTTVQAATGEVDGGAALSLTIADAAAEISSESDPSIAEAVLWQNLDEVGRQAGQSLLRQLGGALTAERVNDGTFIVRVNWRPSA